MFEELSAFHKPDIREVIQFPPFFLWHNFHRAAKEYHMMFIMALWRISPELLTELHDHGVDRLFVFSHDAITKIENVLSDTFRYLLFTRDIPEPFDDRIDRVVLDPDMNRDFTFLRRAVELTGGRLQLILNKIAVFHCQHRYEARCRRYQSYCLLQDVQRCFRLAGGQDLTAELLKARFIRPEDVEVYEELGIHYFHLLLDGLSLDLQREVIHAYLHRSYDGNVFDLFNINAPKYYLGNKYLDGFLKYFHAHGSQCNRKKCRTCPKCRIVAEGTELRHLKELKNL
jgi:hypothetical protein